MSEAVPDAPTVPTDRLEADGWRRTEASTETLFELSRAKVVGHTLVYEHGPLRDRVRAVTDGRLDLPWRFFFATRLAFSPSLPPGIGAKMVAKPVRDGARRGFIEDLEDRGFHGVELQSTERIRVRTGDRAHLFRYSARYTFDELELADPPTLSLQGLLAVWHRDGRFLLGGGAYPIRGLDTAVAAARKDADPDTTLEEDVAGNPTEYRDALLGLLREIR